MNNPEFLPSAQTRTALNTALSALRANPLFWQQPLDRAIEQVLHVATLLPATGAQLWQRSAEHLPLRLHSQSPAQSESVDPALATTETPAFIAALMRVEPFTLPATQTNVVYLGITIEGALWGALVLHGTGTMPWSERVCSQLSALGDVIAQVMLTCRTRDAEQRFHALTQSAPIGILQYDENRRVVYRNQYLVELLGADYSCFTPEVWSRFVTTEDGHDIGLDVETVQRSGMLQANYKVTRPDGSERHILWHVISPQPTTGARIGIALDITPLWQAQQQLRELSIRQRAILDHAAHAIVTTDMEGRITLFNPAAERLLGYRAEEALGQSTQLFHVADELQVLSRELQHESFAGNFAGFIAKTMQAGLNEREWTFRRKDGTKVPVLASTTLMQNANGEPLGMIGIAIDQTDRKRVEQMERREQSLITHISRGTNTAVGEQFFNQLIAALHQATGADYANIFVLQPERDGLYGALLKDPLIDALHTEVFDFHDGPMEPVLRDGQMVHFANAQASYPQDLDLKQLELMELIAVPLVSSANKILGAVAVGHRGQLPESALAQHLLEIFAVRAASELERLQQERQLRASEAEQHWLHAASEQMHAQCDIAGVARAAVEAGARHSSAPRVSLLIDEGEDYRVLAYEGPAELAPHSPTYPRTFGQNTIELATPNPDWIMLMPNFLETTRNYAMHAEAVARDIQAVAIILLIENGRRIGAMTFDYSNSRALDQLDLNTLATFAHSVALALARAQHREALEYQANHDALTGLFNRSMLHREFAQWRAEDGKNTALLLLDLDRFKEVNDTLGHHFGDALLRQIGERLRTGVNYRKASLARLGGDEFAVLLRGVSVGEARARVLANNLLQALRRPFLVNGISLEIGASIGVALYPEHGKDSHELLRTADVAMYKAKQSGGGVAIYNRDLDFNTPERLALIADFGKAIRQQELVLFYQPKIDLRTHRVVGFEALLRWQHPQLGLLGPDRFLPLIEMTDVIHALTRTVLDIACQQLRDWVTAGETWSVAVNLSARNLIDNRVANYLDRLLRRYQIPAALLELEITETALIQDPTHALAMLNQIAALGVALSIDDFGTGYSSLAYLRDMPISTLKIDRTFVHDMLINPQDELIARSIVQLAHSLDLEVIAEGVEGSEVLTHLQRMGCDQAQGYFISRPLAAAAVPGWLEQWRAGTQLLDEMPDASRAIQRQP